MFMAWLMEQDDREDEVGALVRVIFRDYNNGCLSKLTSVGDIFDHFEAKHPKAFPEVKEYLAMGMDLYVQRRER
jgi:hypothetical protein